MAKTASKWMCPKCGAVPDTHGKGGYDTCREHIAGTDRCQGFLCECDDAFDNNAHGESPDSLCDNAVCYHCGWYGEFPVPLVDPKKLKGWKKTAWAAGWRPPVGAKV